jgi:type I restriction enzyme S subunit
MKTRLMKQRYREYKSSGVEWIGEIPNTWRLIRLKFLTKLIPSNVDKHIFENERKVRLCNYTDVY